MKLVPGILFPNYGVGRSWPKLFFLPYLRKNSHFSEYRRECLLKHYLFYDNQSSKLMVPLSTYFRKPLEMISIAESWLHLLSFKLDWA